jgi:hypothetical protein
MAKWAAHAFDRKLVGLFKDRTHWLRMQVRKPRPGNAPSFNKKKVEREITKLQNLATKCLLHSHAVKGLGDLYDVKKQWHVTASKGYGIDSKRKAFIQWFENHIPYDNCVYAFWRNRKCRYIGRTMGGKNRPQSQFQKYWFPGVTRIDIYASRGSRDIPRLECLASHRFEPTYSKIKPASRKWNSKCPICETRKAVRDEVKAIFKLR